MMAVDHARRHEMRLLAASKPAFPVLLTLGRFARPIRRVPGLGWVVGDLATMRRILTARGHFTIVGEGVTLSVEELKSERLPTVAFE